MLGGKLADGSPTNSVEVHTTAPLHTNAPLRGNTFQCARAPALHPPLHFIAPLRSTVPRHTTTHLHTAPCPPPPSSPQVLRPGARECAQGYLLLLVLTTNPPPATAAGHARVGGVCAAQGRPCGRGVLVTAYY